MNNIPYLAIAKVVGFAACLYLAYDYGATKVSEDWQTERAALNKATAEALIAVAKNGRDAADELREKEKDAWGKYEEASREVERLNDELATRPWRVRIQPGNCTNVPGTEGAGDVGGSAPGGYAELPDSVTRSLAAVGRRANLCEAKLAYMVEWAEYAKKVVRQSCNIKEAE